VFLNLIFNTDLEMDPDPDPDPDPELPEKSDPDPEIIFPDPSHCGQVRYIMEISVFVLFCWNYLERDWAGRRILIVNFLIFLLFYITVGA